MKSMSDEIVSTETVRAVEASLRSSIQEQSSMTISRIRSVRNFAIILAVANVLLTIAVAVLVLYK